MLSNNQGSFGQMDDESEPCPSVASSDDEILKKFEAVDKGESDPSSTSNQQFHYPNFDHSDSEYESEVSLAGNEDATFTGRNFDEWIEKHANLSNQLTAENSSDGYNSLNETAEVVDTTAKELFYKSNDENEENEENEEEEPFYCSEDQNSESEHNQYPSDDVIQVISSSDEEGGEGEWNKDENSYEYKEGQEEIDRDGDSDQDEINYGYDDPENILHEEDSDFEENQAEYLTKKKIDLQRFINNGSMLDHSNCYHKNTTNSTDDVDLYSKNQLETCENVISDTSYHNKQDLVPLSLIKDTVTTNNGLGVNSMDTVNIDMGDKNKDGEDSITVDMYTDNAYENKVGSDTNEEMDLLTGELSQTPEEVGFELGIPQTSELEDAERRDVNMMSENYNSPPSTIGQTFDKSYFTCQGEDNTTLVKNADSEPGDITQLRDQSFFNSDPETTNFLYEKCKFFESKEVLSVDQRHSNENPESIVANVAESSHKPEKSSYVRSNVPPSNYKVLSLKNRLSLPVSQEARKSHVNLNRVLNCLQEITNKADLLVSEVSKIPQKAAELSENDMSRLLDLVNIFNLEANIFQNPKVSRVVLRDKIASLDYNYSRIVEDYNLKSNSEIHTKNKNEMPGVEKLDVSSGGTTFEDRVNSEYNLGILHAELNFIRKSLNKTSSDLDQAKKSLLKYEKKNQELANQEKTLAKENEELKMQLLELKSENNYLGLQIKGLKSRNMNSLRRSFGILDSSSDHNLSQKSTPDNKAKSVYLHTPQPGRFRQHSGNSNVNGISDSNRLLTSGCKVGLSPQNYGTGLVNQRGHSNLVNTPKQPRLTTNQMHSYTHLGLTRSPKASGRLQKTEMLHSPFRFNSVNRGNLRDYKQLGVQYSKRHDQGVNYASMVVEANKAGELDYNIPESASNKSKFDQRFGTPRPVWSLTTPKLSLSYGSKKPRFG